MLASTGKWFMLTRFLALSLLATAAMQPITIKTTTLFDGHGHVFRNRQITIEDGRITRIAGHVLLTINADFERAAKGCFGVIRGKLERDRELYGYGWIGWGQAFGNNWKRAAACQVDMVYPPPVRPLDSAEGTKTRKEMVVSFRSLISQQDVGKLPVIVRCKRK
jgi:hypothetical protein